jgi:rhamnopyranosyl-N-acetylglucosaminyl-diphospho-decaprenol beta-1,3/1,4-galactofuranosyltransferase
MTSCCGIVTYNRYALLKNCLQSVCRQTLTPNLVIIFDNASLDGTTDSLRQEYGLVETARSKTSVIFTGSVCGIKLLLYSSAYNGGGSLGFHTITRHFYENTCYDSLWLMDDDGTPHSHALAELSARNENYCGALVMSDVNHNDRAFQLHSKDVNSVNPFNSILVSRNLIGVVGYPRYDFFIYGDEVEYDLRIKSYGFKSVLVKDAIHFHPADRQITKKNMLLGTYKVIKGPLRQYCYYRNTSYNIYKYHGSKKLIKWWSKVIVLLLIRRELNEIIIFLKAIFELRKEKFSDHRNYLP